MQSLSKVNWRTVFSIRKSDIAAGVLGIFVFLVIIPTYTYAYYSKSLDDKETLMNRNDTGIVLFDRNGTPFFSFYQGKAKAFTPLNQIPKDTRNALIASEDKEFYQHPGFSIQAIARSLYDDFRTGSFSYGGSTITQQLVKNVLLTPQKSFLRKYQEITLAYETERRFSKDEVLEMYLNSVYFGEGAFGIEEAAQIYFNEPASQLDLAQSAMLVALLPAPSKLSPIHGDLQAAKVRQKIVLQKMVEQGLITQTQADEAANEPLYFGPSGSEINREAIHFALMVRDELVNKYGEEAIARSGFKVTTTLDLNYQRYAQGVVQNQVAALVRNGVTNGAAVVMDPKTGEVLALVGSRDWSYPGFGQVNIALSPRQPGSSFKPIYYSAALEQGIITPATILQDKPTDFGGGYRPKDYDGGYRGPVTVRRALSNSLNIPSVQVMTMLGVSNAIEEAKKFGITTLSTPQDYGLSLALGAGEVKLLEMTGAYSVLADSGQKNETADILQIEDKYGDIVYQYQPHPQQVLSPNAAFLISSILSDNNTRAEEFGDTLNISRPAAVKTGTTENYRDAWTLGYTPSLAVGAWVGNNNGAPMDNVAGSLGAAPIWKQLMEHFLADKPIEKFAPPEQSVALYNCKSTIITQQSDPSDPGKKINQEQVRSYQEYFIPGTAPAYCSLSTQTSPTLSPSATPTPTGQQPTSIPATPTPTISGPTPVSSTPTPTPLQPTPTATPPPPSPVP